MKPDSYKKAILMEGKNTYKKMIQLCNLTISENLQFLFSCALLEQEKPKKRHPMILTTFQNVIRTNKGDLIENDFLFFKWAEYEWALL